ncbi:TetR family transcriptional regulator C-terminal domain-containing protein [Aquimarina sp. 2201CG5-10]|uniref:TetR family transcriptional regulator C-terminal domain-containing protein n=1 Tax=Aquimarina callyspongiae TaxID=3098150 RepID=UPI002AB3CD78|nr:TetR family transcriptional regulator C-terminal domain-containing protein [Aquimarina sp. 2201CG5-10]MDY8137874.1 TetR family transcriptional regulator C-terminal domain-containing protein [Aquimarina sp. 2201CG5-10]
MASSNRKKAIDAQSIISKYMEYVLENDGYPVSVYKFCKEIKISEEDFYRFFGSIENLTAGVWNAFYKTTVDVISKNSEYPRFSSRDKVLTFFYTFFELLTLNRSYVLFVLKPQNVPFKNLEQLKDLRNHIKDFAGELIKEDNDTKLYNITKNPVSVYTEGAWMQFLFILKFWVDDSSPSFEKTDVAIEKSVNTIFDLLDNTPLNNVLDFGKFLWKEKFMWN